MQSFTQEASEDGDSLKEVLGDVYKDDRTTGFSNETQIEVQWIKEDDPILQNGVEYRQDDATRNQIENQETANKKHQTKKSKFGGLKKGFLL